MYVNIFLFLDLILGSLYFFPINALPVRKKRNVAQMLKDGLESIVARAEKKTVFGRLAISPKKQNQIGNTLCSIYLHLTITFLQTHTWHHSILSTLWQQTFQIHIKIMFQKLSHLLLI